MPVCKVRDLKGRTLPPGNALAYAFFMSWHFPPFGLGFSPLRSFPPTEDKEIKMPTIKVSNADQLQSAIGNAKSGDTILLGNSNYGNVTLSGMPEGVSIEAENEGKAVFGKVTFKGDNISLDGAKITGGVFGGWIENLKITNSEILGTSNFREINGLVLQNNDMTSNGENMGLLLNGIRNFSVKGNTIHEAVEDLVRITGNSYNGTFENNTVSDALGKGALHCDLLQVFALNGYTPHDITIRGNLFYDDPTTGTRTAQGLFIAGAQGDGYKNILIEDNLIATPHINSIYISGGQENVVIRNNTLLPGTYDGGGVIRLAPKTNYDNSGVTIENNVLKAFYDQTKSSDIGNNHVYGAGNADELFNMGSKAGAKWQDFLPKDGSAVDFGTNMGALGRLKDLLGGKDDGAAVAPTPSKPEPTPTPEPTPEPIPVKPPVVETPDDGDSNVVYEMGVKREYSGQIYRAVTINHDQKMEIAEGNIELTFNADTLGWRRALISKDSKEQGDHVSAWLDNGTLKVTFQNEKGNADFSVGGIKTKTDYDLKLSFENGKVGVWLDGQLKGEKTFDFSLEDNSEKITLGAYNGRSTAGTTDARHYAFDGKISNVKITETGDGDGNGGSTTPATPGQKVNQLFNHDEANLNGTVKSVVSIDHDKALEIDEGTIAFSFNADTVSKNHGLVSKASIEQRDDFSSWISNGKLVVQFQNDQDTIQITHSGIKAGQDHDVQATFDEDHVQVWLDGKMIGERDFDMDWSQNHEHLEIGAVNFSASGMDNKLQYFFNGTISDVEIYDSALSPEDLQDMHDSGAVHSALI